MTRQLVVTADDLGIDAPTNAAIVDLLAQGLITSTTLMTVAPAARDAVARVRAAGVATPRLHVTLTSARELSPWRPLAPGVHSLTDMRGAFHVDPSRFEAGAADEHVAAEMSAQLGWMRDAGLEPAAVDSHSGSLYGFRGRSFLPTVMDFTSAQGMGFRLPRRFGRLVTAVLPRSVRRRHADAVERADAGGVRLPETMIGSWLPGRLLVTYAQLRHDVLTQLRALPEGISELVMHPAPAAAVRRMPQAEGRKRVWELALLRDPVLHRVLRRERIELVPAW